MTTVYFVRHAQSDHSNKDEQTRGLSEQGKTDVASVTRFLEKQKVDVAYSSPYQRAIDTIADYTKKHNILIQPLDGFREWQRCADPTVSFEEMCRRHWADFDYRYLNGESLREVQERNIAALDEVLMGCEGESVIIGTHGMALSTIIHFYDPNFGFAEFSHLLPLMPLIVKMTFNRKMCLDIEIIEIV